MWATFTQAANSVPESYDRTIADLWLGFKNPVVYTPGDNEWTDCHKKKQGGHLGVDYADGDPLANLDLVRSIFFANPGYALGGATSRCSPRRNSTISVTRRTASTSRT